MRKAIVAEGSIEIFEDGTIYRLLSDGGKDVPPIHVHRNKTRGSKVGYPTINSQVGGKQKHWYVHRLFAQAFVPNPNNYKYVEMTENDPYKINATNVRWISKAESTSKSVTTRKSRNVTCEKCGHRYHISRKTCSKCEFEEKKKTISNLKKEAKLLKIRESFKGVDLEELKQPFKEALEMRLDGKTLEEIGASQGVTRERIRQMLNYILKGGGRIDAGNLHKDQWYEDKIRSLEIEIEILKRKVK